MPVVAMDYFDITFEGVQRREELNIENSGHATRRSQMRDVKTATLSALLSGVSVPNTSSLML